MSVILISGLFINFNSKGVKLVKFKWLLLSGFSMFLFALPAQAGRLVVWRMAPNQNQLTFTTDAGVQPKAMLMMNPTRLIIDLPGISLNSKTVNQKLNGAMDLLRVGQVDQSTTRLVVQLKEGFTYDPQQIRFRGATPRQWSVTLPAPQRVVEQPSGS